MANVALLTVLFFGVVLTGHATAASIDARALEKRSECQQMRRFDPTDGHNSDDGTRRFEFDTEPFAARSDASADRVERRRTVCPNGRCRPDDDSGRGPSGRRHVVFELDDCPKGWRKGRDGQCHADIYPEESERCGPDWNYPPSRCPEGGWLDDKGRCIPLYV